MKKESNEEKDRNNIVSKIVYECISTHNELIIIDLIIKLEKNYIEIAKLATLGQYKTSWTHEELINFLTYENT